MDARAGRNQVFADGQVMIEARFPNRPAPGLEMYVADLSPLWPTFGEFSIPDSAREPGRVTSRLLEGQPADYWKGAIYYGVHYEGWCGQTGIIESSQPGAIRVGHRTNGWWFPGADPGGYQPEEGRGMIVGHMNALDQPGEWHWQQNTLYFIPPTGTKPGRVEAKHRQLAFDLSGASTFASRGSRSRRLRCAWRIRPGASWIAAGYRTSRTSPFSTVWDRSPRGATPSSRARRGSLSAATTTGFSTPASVSAPEPGFICGAIIIRSTIA